MWKRKAGCGIMHQCLIALIYGQMKHGGGCDSCDNKQRMEMVARERRNARSVVYGRRSDGAGKGWGETKCSLEAHRTVSV